MDHDLQRLRREFVQENHILSPIARAYISHLERVIGGLRDEKSCDMGFCEREASLELQSYLNDGFEPLSLEYLRSRKESLNAETWDYHIFHVDEPARRLFPRRNTPSQAIQQELNEILTAAKNDGYQFVAIPASDTPSYVTSNLLQLFQRNPLPRYYRPS
jgi:hypothetical protein